MSHNYERYRSILNHEYPIIKIVTYGKIYRHNKLLKKIHMHKNMSFATVPIKIYFNWFMMAFT